MILVINSGSSSIKFTVYAAGEPAEILMAGQVKNIGHTNTVLEINGSADEPTVLPDSSYDSAIDSLTRFLEKKNVLKNLMATGHRVVHGMKNTEPALVTDKLLAELKSIIPYDSEHLPNEISLVEAFAKACPGIKQVLCFDTSFHTEMPRIAKLLPIPRRYFDLGIQRYGFHGLSYTYLLQQLRKMEDVNAANGNIILAHLGNGSSLAAIKNGKSMETSMGFSPSSGLVMGTRTGDIDPGMALYLLREEKMDTEQLSNFFNKESGLLGVSGASNNMQEILAKEKDDPSCREAVDLYCYQVKKWIGSFTTVLSGLDGLVFTGGIGENAPQVRARICSGLEFLGIVLDEEKNNAGSPIISKAESRVCVRVIRTDEDAVIWQSVNKILQGV